MKKVKYICVWSINGKVYTKMIDKYFDTYEKAYNSGVKRFTNHKRVGGCNNFWEVREKEVGE
jgi:hypothetical protein